MKEWLVFKKRKDEEGKATELKGESTKTRRLPDSPQGSVRQQVSL